MAQESPQEVQGNAPDKPHHPANPNLNFIWLYATIGAVFVISVLVKIMTVLFKKRRDKKRDPDLERQQLEPFKRWWYPWRYNKKGELITPPTASDGTASPALLSGALSPNSISSPIRLEDMEARLHRAGMSDSASTASLLSSPGLNPGTTAAASLVSDGSGSRAKLPAVNPFTSRPFRSNIPRATDRSDPGADTTPTRSASKATGHRFNDGQFGRSLAHEGARSRETDQQSVNSSLKSGIAETDFAHGYGAKSSSGSRRNDSASGTAPSRGDRREQPATDSDKRRQARQPSKSHREPDRAPSSRDNPSKPTKRRPSALHITPSRAESSQRTPSSSRTSSSQAPPSSSRNPSSQTSSSYTPSSSSGTPKPYSALGGGKFRNVVRSDEDKFAKEWREKKEAEEAGRKKKEEEEAERKRKKQEEREAKKKNGGGGLRDLVGAGKKPAK